MKQHVASLEGELNNGVATKAQKVSEKDAMQAVLDAAEATREASKEAVKSAEGKVAELEAEKLQRKESCSKQEEVLSELNIKVFTEQCALDFCGETLKTFAFLRDQVAAAPEPEKEKQE